MSESGLLKQSDWLHKYGFERNPFESGAWRAQEDNLFKKNDEVFLDFLGIEEIVLENVPFVFGKQGTGKTAIKQRIKIFCAQRSQFGDTDKILVLDYDNHDYSDYSLMQHITRIIDALISRLQDLSVKTCDNLLAISNANFDAKNKLIRIDNEVKNFGFTKLLILIDNIDPDRKHPLPYAYQKIESIATNSDILGLNLFRLFLPIRINDFDEIKNNFSLVNTFPHRLIEWDIDKITNLYKRRLTACLTSGPRDAAIANFGSLCEYDLYDVDARLVGFGSNYGNPRAVWMLGHYMLDEHFSRFPGRLASQDKKIRVQSYDLARKRVEKLLRSDHTSTKPVASKENRVIADNTYYSPHSAFENLPSKDSASLKKELVYCLLDYQQLEEVANRDFVIKSLSKGIRQNVLRGGTAKIDIENIVDKCMEYSNGLNELYNSLKNLFGEQSICVEMVREIFDRYLEQ